MSPLDAVSAKLASVAVCVYFFGTAGGLGGGAGFLGIGGGLTFAFLPPSLQGGGGFEPFLSLVISIGPHADLGTLPTAHL